MNEPVRERGRQARPVEADLRALHAYHDGELRGLARWRFGRRLARSPELQRELRGISELGVRLREHAAQAPGPELWERIALRLPAADARRHADATLAGPAMQLGWLRPLGAAAATLAVAALVAQQWLGPAAVDRAGVVRWMDSRGRSVMVLEEDEENATTVIWLLDGERSVGTVGGERGAS
jgi:anti-sigma factor RsiW